MVAPKSILSDMLRVDTIVNKLPTWMAKHLPESLRPKPVIPPTLWQQLTGSWIFIAVMAGLVLAFAVLWSRYGLSPYAVWNRVMSFRAKAQGREMLMILHRAMVSESKRIKSVPSIEKRETNAKGSSLQPAADRQWDSEVILQDYFGFKAVMEAQKTYKALKNHPSKSKGEAEAKLPNPGSVVESLMSAIPMAHRTIPLWFPATKSNHEWYSTSLVLPGPLLRHMQHHHAGLPESILTSARLGIVYHRICHQRQSDAQRNEASITNKEGLPRHCSNDVFDRPLQALWTVALCPEPYSRVGAQWGRLGFSSEDPISELKDGGIYALEDLTWFAKTYPAAHREILLYIAHKKEEAAQSLVPSGLADSFSEAAASFLISVMLTRIPKAFADEEDEDEHLTRPSPKSEASSGGEMASPLKDENVNIQKRSSFAPHHRDGSSLQFTPTMIRYLYGGASAVSMFAPASNASNVPREQLPFRPTGQDEKSMRQRLKQLHSCYLRAFFDLWRRDEPLSQELFLLKTFYAESGMLVDSYLGKVMS